MLRKNLLKLFALLLLSIVVSCVLVSVFISKSTTKPSWCNHFINKESLTKIENSGYYKSEYKVYLTCLKYEFLGSKSSFAGVKEVDFADPETFKIILSDRFQGMGADDHSYFNYFATDGSNFYYNEKLIAEFSNKQVLIEEDCQTREMCTNQDCSEEKICLSEINSMRGQYKARIPEDNKSFELTTNKKLGTYKITEVTH